MKFIVSHTPTGVCVQASGELDVTSGPQLYEVLQNAGSLAEAVLIDLADVTFMDSCGLSTLIRAHAALEEANVRLRIANPRPAVARVIELTGVDDYLSVDRHGAEAEPA